MKEMLDIVNEKDEIIGIKERKEVEEKGLLHRVAYVYVHLNGKVLIEKRSKSKRPGHYTIVGETVQSGESYGKAAYRGVKEETGLKAGKLRLLGKIQSNDKEEKDNKIVEVFSCEGKGKVMAQEEEVEEIIFLEPKKIQAFIERQRKIAPAFVDTFKVYKEKMLDG